VAQQDGPVLAQNPREHAVAQTAVFDVLQKDADALVRRIIDANLGRARAPAQAVAPVAARPGA